MARKKACITGANGFIGKNLLSALLKNGYDVNVLSRRNSPGLFPSIVKVIEGDLTSEDCHLDQFLDDCDIIFHCAGETRNIDLMRALHVDGTARLAQTALNVASKRKKPIHWVHLSSVGVYGPPEIASEERVVTEESPYKPVGEYEVTKKLADDLLIDIARSRFLTLSIVRPSNVFGNDMYSSSIDLLAKAVRKRLFFYIGSKDAIATYIHINDVVDLLLQCAVNPNAKGEIFNISNDRSLQAVINAIASKMNLSSPKWSFPEKVVRTIASIVSFFVRVPLTKERIDVLVARTAYPTSKSESKLGFSPKVDIEAKIKEIVR